MAGTAYRKMGPETYSPADNEVVRAGRLVEAVAGGRIRQAVAGSLKVLGYAYTDAIAPEDTQTGTTTDALDRPVLPAVPIPTSTAVGHGETARLVYAANAAFGDYLIAASDGRVTPAGANPDYRTVVGRCVEPGGVVVATSTTGLSRVTP